MALPACKDASSIELTYFNIEAVAEKVRLALVLSGVPFEDKRITFDEWRELKPSTPFGQVPVMKVNGSVTLAQSEAMLRWVGRTGPRNLCPEDKAHLIDEVIGLSGDFGRSWQPALYVGMRPESMGHVFADDDEGKASKQAKTREMREKFVAETLPTLMGHYTRILEGPTGGDFFCGSEVTIADLCVLPQLRYFKKGVADFVPADCLDAHATVMAWMARMEEIPEIKEWYSRSR